MSRTDEITINNKVKNNRGITGTIGKKRKVALSAAEMLMIITSKEAVAGSGE